MLYRLSTFVAVLTSCAGMALADCSWPDEKDPVKITLVVILASDKGDTIDKRLKGVAAEVQKLHPHLRSFTWHAQERREMKPNEKISMDCIDDTKVDMIVKHGADKDNKVTLWAKPPMMSPLEYQTVCGKFLPIVTPYKTKKKGETLILAIRVEPCRGN